MLRHAATLERQPEFQRAEVKGSQTSKGTNRGGLTLFQKENVEGNLLQKGNKKGSLILTKQGRQLSLRNDP